MRVTWILPDRQISAEVPVGQNLMQAATAANVPLVIGECGGNLSCATCHVRVHADFAPLTGGPSAFEDAMLDATDAPRCETSRLSCQIVMRAELDGLILLVPQP